MNGLRILITCESLAGRGGIELYVRDVARGLLRLGHTPIVYAKRQGEVASEIRNLTIPVVERLTEFGASPDLIFGQHHLPTVAALSRFPDAPAIYVCHDWYGHSAFAPRFPRILRYVAVDAPCRDRLVCEDGVAESRVILLPSFVDLDRFKQRPPLPARPHRALAFGNYTEENAHLAALRDACASRGIALDVIGSLMKNAVARPEEVLSDYDVVFAKGRAALEALAVGAAVVIYAGVRYLGPMVKAEEVERLLPLNFGVRAMGDALTPEELRRRAGEQLDRYDPSDAARASTLARGLAGQAAAIHAVAELCEEVVAEHAQSEKNLDPRAGEEEEGAAVATYLERLQEQHALLWGLHQDMQGSTVAKLNRSLSRHPRLSGLLRPLARALTRRR